MRDYTYRYECACGQRGRWYRNPNDAVGAGERHIGLDKLYIPCKHKYTSTRALHMQRRDPRNNRVVTIERL